MVWSMVVTIDQIEKFMGQNVKDEYGRIMGKILTAFTDVSGNVESIEIALNDFSLERISSDRIKLTPDGVIVLAEWKVKAITTENKLDRVRKRIRAVEELYRKGSIPGHAYEEIKTRLEAQFKSVKDEVRKVKELLRKRANDLEDQIIRLEKDISNLMVLYMSNEVSESAYKAAIDYLRDAKARNAEEKKDVEKHLDLITKLESEATSAHRPAPIHTPVKESSEPEVQHEGPIQVQIIEA